MKIKKNSSARVKLQLLFFLGIFTLLLLVPLTVTYITKQKTNTRSNATASTTLSFATSTQQVGVGQSGSADIMINPGNNLVTFIDLVIDYDSSVITLGQNSITTNTTAFPTTLDGPTNNCNGTQCSLEIQLSIGANPTNAISQPTKVGTLNFQGVATGNTQVTFDSKTSILSISASDTPSENVLSTTTPISITVGTGSGTTATPTSANGTTPTPLPTNPDGTTPTPTITSVPLPTGTGLNTFSFSFALPGIGANGGNTHPAHPARKVHIIFYNVDTAQTYTDDDTFIFDGKYFTKNQFDISSLPPGQYEIFLRTPYTLTTRLAQSDGTSIFTVPDANNPNAQPLTIPVNTLISGDVAPNASLTTYGDDILDLLDYNTVINCYKHTAPSATCTNLQAANLDDNNIVDGVDYNILLRGFSITTMGDPVPVAPMTSTQIKNALKMHTTTGAK